MIRIFTLLFSLTFMVFVIAIESSFANQQEEELIRQNKAAAKSSTNSAMFIVHRIKCLKSNDRTALNACNKALSIKPNDAAIKNKKIALHNKLNPKPKPQPNRRVTKAPAPQKIQAVKKIPTPQKIQPAKKVPTHKNNRITNKQKKPINNKVRKAKPLAPSPNNKIREDKKKVISQIQQKLNALGFNAGIADGIAGKNTKQAIKDFQVLTKSLIRPKIDKELLFTLTKAQKQHNVADKQYTLAKQQFSDGDLDATSIIIEKYLSIAPWHKNLRLLDRELKEQIAQNEEEKIRKENTDRLAAIKAASDLAKQTQIEEQNSLRKRELDILVTLAQSQFASQDNEGATSTINKGLLLSPDNETLLNLQERIQIISDKRIKLNIIISNSKQMFQSGNYEDSLSLIENGLILNPNHTDLLTLKDKIILRQKDIQVQKEKDETLSILYSRALISFNNNELDSAIAFVEKGLSLEPEDLNLLKLKSNISTKEEEIRLKNETDKKLANITLQASNNLQNNHIEQALKIVNEGLTQFPNTQSLLELKSNIILKEKELTKLEQEKRKKVAMLLSLIKQKQDLLEVIDNNALTQNQTLLNQAQQTLENSLIQ